MSISIILPNVGVHPIIIFVLIGCIVRVRKVGPWHGMVWVVGVNYNSVTYDITVQSLLNAWPDTI